MNIVTCNIVDTMAQTLPQLDNSEYAVRWIAALPYERAAAEAMLDKEHALP